MQSNCLSVEPVETEFGRKRRINQNTCNLDYSCLKGFCPSFVTVEGGQLKKPKKEAKGDLSALPADPRTGAAARRQRQRTTRAWGIVVGGVGGTGVITIGQLLGMAAHIEGKGVVTQDAGGLAQKGGATWSHIQIADRPETIHTTKVDTAQADLVIACDSIVGATKYTLSVMQQGRTYVALNTHGTPTAAFVKNADWQFPGGNCEAAVRASVGDATRRRVRRRAGGGADDRRLDLHQSAAARLRLAAGPHSAQPRGADAGDRTQRRAGRQQQGGVRMGPALRARPDGGAGLFKAQQVIQFVKKPSLDELVATRVEFLTGYQDAAYAARYKAFVDKVRTAEAPLSSTRLGEAVARYLFKLMAIKDEYEVARLHTDPRFHERIAAQFEGDYKLNFHLAPPAISKRNSQGELVKKAYGPWMLTAFGVLARLKGLRGTAFDVFGRTEERRTERALIAEYRACIDELLQTLSAERLVQAAEIARIPEEIRGYGRVKERHLVAARAKWAQLMQAWRASPAPQRQAA